MTKMRKIFILILFLFISFSDVKGDVPAIQQYFRVQPKGVTALEGSEVILQCEVEYLAGRVQWTKDGFALGFQAVIPGFPRYMMVGDSQHGVFNLRIRNVSLEDDAEFQCQVGPSRGPASHKPIRASANLTVISPPSSIELSGYPANSKVEIRQNHNLTLECLVKKSKPAATIAWFRGSSELKLDNREDKITESDNNVSVRGKLYDVTSRIHLRPTAEDDYVNYVCEARHEALLSDMPLRTSVQLSVLYPPGAPYIEGYSTGEPLRRGQTVELICRSRGGNPPAQLIWYKNGEQVHALYRPNGRITENIYTFTAEMSDNNAKYTCEASSTVGPAHLKADVNLTVHYAPVHVTISGQTEANLGDRVQLNCTTGASNPAAQIRWMVDGRQASDTSSQIEPAIGQGWITSSVISIPISSNKMNIVVICHGVNTQLAENVVATHTINILHAPGQPEITGYKKGTYIAAGNVQGLTCTSSGGNPLPVINWYKNDKKIPSVSRNTDRSTVVSDITILANATDNEAVYKCETLNAATVIPLFESVKLNVHFPPDNVVIKKEPKEFIAGSKGKLICDASSSNPEAELTWWREGIPVIEFSNKSSKAGLHGGRVTSIELNLDLSSDMDGDVYTCQAANVVLERSVQSHITLSVLYKPIFAEINETSFTGVEGGNITITLQATGHPSSIRYTWRKDNEPLSKNVYHVVDGPHLSITKLDRKDAGVYTCEAVNSQGSSSSSFRVNVQYAAGVVSTSDVVMVGEGEEAKLSCDVDGNPLSADHVTWKRPGYLMDKKTSISFNNVTSVLTVRSVSLDDMGAFYCVVNNGIADDFNRSAYLLVKHKPEVDSSPVLSKAASDIGYTAKLICKSSGAPKPSFSWARDGTTIPVNTTQKYYITHRQLNVAVYESLLLIKNVELKDYGNYRCTVRNALGFSSTTVKLSVPTSPDPPLSINVVNASYDSVTISWSPGFDGGGASTYRIRYRPVDSAKHAYKYEEVSNDTTYTITGLQFATSYFFNVMTQNKLGKSQYMPEPLKASTTSDAPPSLPSLGGVSSGEHRISLVVGAAVALILIILNVFLVGFCLVRRTKKQVTTESNEQTSNKSGTIEMYAPSSYNETMTGETLSSVSEKSETYSEPQDYKDEKRKNVGNTYVIEPIDYPFQYPYDTHIKENGTIGRNPYCNHNGTGYQSESSSRYSSTADPRYVTYPPPVQFAQPPIQSPPLPLNHHHHHPYRSTVPPPDVTVLTTHSNAPLSTFTYSNMETEGHLV